jgi:membrane-bound lytic murein transglycosylase B
MLLRAAHATAIRWREIAVALMLSTSVAALALHGGDGAASTPRTAPADGTVAVTRSAAEPFAPGAAQQRTPGAATEPITVALPGASSTSAAVPVSALAADGIPSVALDAYRRAAARAPASCGIPWPLLGAIGRVESDHGRFAGAVLRSDGTSTRRVIGIALNGVGTALIRDSELGRLDGDPVYDRAVGPMQFIPTTWTAYGADGNNDGRTDPFNIYDATLAAARYLCAAGGNLRTASGQTRAVLTYNQSSAYLADVLGLEATYAAGAGIVVPTAPATPPPLVAAPLPPVNPGPPAARPVRPTTAHVGPVSRAPSPARSSSVTSPARTTATKTATTAAHSTATTAPASAPATTCATASVTTSADPSAPSSALTSASISGSTPTPAPTTPYGCAGALGAAPVPPSSGGGSAGLLVLILVLASLAWSLASSRPAAARAATRTRRRRPAVHVHA